MKLFGQRWRYRIGNSLVEVDNAFTWSMWAQERVRDNGETVAQAGGRWRMRSLLSAPWLTMVGESELRIRMVSRLQGIGVTVALDGEAIEPEETFNAAWSGNKFDWPADADWTPGTKWIALPRAGRAG